jgi:hypothetical protein
LRAVLSDPPPRLVLGLIAAFGAALFGLLLFADDHQPAGRRLLKLAGADPLSYYAVSHSLLFDHDFDLTNEYARLRPDSNFAASLYSIVPATGRPRSVFPIGFSLLELPFLAAGHLVAVASGDARDGYTRPEVAAFFGGVLVFLCLGLCFLYLFLRGLAGELEPSSLASRWAALATLAVWPSTTLLYYSFTLLSQVAAFMATSLFLYAWWRARRKETLRPWVWAGAAAGLMFLCRWQDVLFLVVMVGDELAELGRAGGSWLRSRLAFAAAFGVVIVPQLLQWKAIFGRFLTIPQGTDFFAFPPPHLLRVLFSSQNGWITWTPAVLLGLIGLVLLARRQPRLGLPMMAAVALQWAMVASLRRSWHGHLFGMRTLTSCVALVGVGLLVLFLRASPAGRVAVAVLLVLCSAYTFLFAAQYRLDMVPKEDRLTARELIGDKLSPRQAWRRRAAWDEARSVARQDPARGAALAEEAWARYGPDRNLLGLMAEAHGRAGDAEGRRRAEQELERLLAARLP